MMCVKDLEGQSVQKDFKPMVVVLDGLSYIFLYLLHLCNAMQFRLGFLEIFE